MGNGTDTFSIDEMVRIITHAAISSSPAFQELIQRGMISADEALAVVSASLEEHFVYETGSTSREVNNYAYVGICKVHNPQPLLQSGAHAKPFVQQYEEIRHYTHVPHVEIFGYVPVPYAVTNFIKNGLAQQDDVRGLYMSALVSLNHCQEALNYIVQHGPLTERSMRG